MANGGHTEWCDRPGDFPAWYFFDGPGGETVWDWAMPVGVEHGPELVWARVRFCPWCGVEMSLVRPEE